MKSVFALFGAKTGSTFPLTVLKDMTRHFFSTGRVPPKKGLEQLFELHGFVEHIINEKCLEIYDGRHPKHHLWTGHYQFILDNIKNGDVVLDAGCGASMSYIQKIAGRCKKIDCCDTRQELVVKCARENPFDNVNYEVLDIAKNLPPRKYDVVVMSHVLEHLPDPKSVLENVKKITSKIIIRLPRYDDHWMNLVKKDLGMFYFKDADHKREYILSEAIELVESAGWKVAIALNDIDIKIVGVMQKCAE
ncbi:MAG: class I SAM-dependent methyltransferase [Planctomycetota bacterium]